MAPAPQAVRGTSCPCCRAVTLLEVLLATGLLVTVLSMTFWFYSSSLATRTSVSEEARKARLARTTLDRLAREIRQASLITNENRIGIRGGPEQIWLSTTRLPSRKVAELHDAESPPPGEFDLVKVEYKIARHPDVLHEDGYPRALGLARIERPVPRAELLEGQQNTDEFLFGEEGEEIVVDTSEEGTELPLEDEIAWEELYAPDIHYLRFCYFDGYSWWDSWDVVGENPLPQLVQVTIGFGERPPLNEVDSFDPAAEFCTCRNEDPETCEPLEEDLYSITVRVPQADIFYTSRITRESQAYLEEAGLTQPEEERGDTQ